jgi:hypothetical protein
MPAGEQLSRLSRRLRVTLVVLGLMAIAVILGITACGNATGDARIPTGAVRVGVASRPFGRPVASGYVGLSIEYPSSIAYSGHDPAHVDPVYLQLVRSLTPGQAPVLRFGGDTADWTWWPVPGLRRPGGIRYTLTRQWLAVTRATAAALGARVILGLNLEADSRRLIGTEARALLAGVGRRHVAAFELGNEPELYGVLPWFRASGGTPVLARSPGYGFRQYLRDYTRMVRVLPRRVPLAGPASGAGDWLTGLSHYLRANPGVRTATFHRYPLHRCFTPRDSPTYPTIANLLVPGAASGPATSLAAAARAAHARRVSFRADELNSVSCGGKRGVSDAFASALWGLDVMFNMVRAGVDGVNIHTFRTGRYAPFALSFAAHRWSARVRPLYYGLLLFTRAAPPGARLVHVRMPASRTLHVWATRGPGRHRAVVLINDSVHRPVTVAVRVPGAPTGILQRLRAGSAGSRGGVTLAGQGYGPVTYSGRLPGQAQHLALAPTRGRFVVRVPAASAALLDVSGS